MTRNVTKVVFVNETVEVRRNVTTEEVTQVAATCPRGFFCSAGKKFACPFNTRRRDVEVRGRDRRQLLQAVPCEIGHRDERIGQPLRLHLRGVYLRVPARVRGRQQRHRSGTMPVLRHRECCTRGRLRLRALSAQAAQAWGPKTARPPAPPKDESLPLVYTASEWFRELAACCNSLAPVSSLSLYTSLL